MKLFISGKFLSSWSRDTLYPSDRTQGMANCQGCPAAVQQAYEASLRVKGAKLFNLIPADLRNMDGVMVDTFNSGLDAWLGTVPDQPTIPGRQRSAATNSLLDQVILMN